MAMSGGVDSAVAAYILKNKGYELIGTTMILHDDDSSIRDIADAKKICEALNIEHVEIDLRQEFRTDIIEYFASTYENGGTPNPCVICNKKIKFGRLMSFCDSMGCDLLATGHYARIKERKGHYCLMKACDIIKDQSYFMAMVPEKVLKRVLLPLGELTKDDVRQIASSQNFTNASKKDSQDICFIKGKNYVDFLEDYRGGKYEQGTYLDSEGNFLGTNRGSIAYTIGQRKGLGIALGERAFVYDKCVSRNEIYIGSEKLLYSSSLKAIDMNYYMETSNLISKSLTAKIKYGKSEHPATISPLPNGEATVSFREAVRAISPGQEVVLYENEYVVGGGIIAETHKI